MKIRFKMKNGEEYSLSEQRYGASGPFPDRTHASAQLSLITEKLRCFTADDGTVLFCKHISNAWIEDASSLISEFKKHIAEKKYEKAKSFIENAKIEVNEIRFLHNAPLLSEVSIVVGFEKNYDNAVFSFLKYLLSIPEIDVNIKDKDEETALSHFIGFLGRSFNEKGDEIREIIDLFLEKGADINGKHFKGQSLAYKAVRIKNLNLLKYLIKKGLNIMAFDNEENSLIKIAFYENSLTNDTKEINLKNSLEIAAFLLEKGYDINHRNIENDALLISEVLQSRYEHVVFLLSNGSDIKITQKKPDEDYRLTALTASVFKPLEKYDHRITKLLVSNGADVNECVSDGFLPLNLAIGLKNKEAVQYFIEIGADPQKRDSAGENAFNIANVTDDDEIMKILKDSFPKERDKINTVNDNAKADHSSDDYIVNMKSFNKDKSTEYEDTDDIKVPKNSFVSKVFIFFMGIIVFGTIIFGVMYKSNDNVKTQRDLCSVSFDANISGVTVTFFNEISKDRSCTTPCKIEGLESGTYRAEFRKNGYKVKEEIITLRNGEDIKINTQLQESKLALIEQYISLYQKSSTDFSQKCPSEYEALYTLLQNKISRQELAEIINRGASDLDQYHLDKIRDIASPQSIKKQKQMHKDYVPILVNDKTIEKGLQFFEEKKDVLLRAYRETSVKPEDIMAILNWESKFGEHLGTYSVYRIFMGEFCYISEIEEELFQNNAYENENAMPRVKALRRIERLKKSAVSNMAALILMAIEKKYNLYDIKGSWGGAIGIPQFMPASMTYAADGSGDNEIDLNNMDDAIFSIANYLKVHEYSQKGSQYAFQRYNKEKMYVRGVTLYSKMLMDAGLTY